MSKSILEERASEAVSSKPSAIVTCCTLVTARSCARQMHVCVKSGRCSAWPPTPAAAAGFQTRRWPAVSPSITWSRAARSASMPGLHARGALQQKAVSPQRPAWLVHLVRLPAACHCADAVLGMRTAQHAQQATTCLRSACPPDADQAITCKDMRCRRAEPAAANSIALCRPQHKDGTHRLRT